MTELYCNTAIPNYSIFASFFINQTKVFHYYQILNFLISLQFGQIFIFIIDPSNNYYTRFEQIDIPNTPRTIIFSRKKKGT